MGRLQITGGYNRIKVNNRLSGLPADHQPVGVYGADRPVRGNFGADRAGDPERPVARRWRCPHGVCGYADLCRGQSEL